MIRNMADGDVGIAFHNGRDIPLAWEGRVRARVPNAGSTSSSTTPARRGAGALEYASLHFIVTPGTY